MRVALTWAVLLSLATAAWAGPERPAAAPAAAPQGDTSPNRSRSSSSVTAAPRPERDDIESLRTQLVGHHVELGELRGKPIVAISVETTGRIWGGPTHRDEAPTIRRVAVGEPLSAAAARRALRELLSTGRFAQARVDVRPYEHGAILRVIAVPRRLVAAVRIEDDELGEDEILEAMAVTKDAEVTEPMLPVIAQRVTDLYHRRGYDQARVRVTTTDTDDPLRVVLHVEAVAGPRREITQRIFVIEPAMAPLVGDLKSSYEVEAGDPADEDALDAADRELETELQEERFLEAQVQHRVLRREDAAYLYVYLDTGPLYRFDFEGNRTFDDATLLETLGLDDNPDTNPEQLRERLRTHYVARGLLDAAVDVEERGGPTDPVHQLSFRIRERQPVRVVRRWYPCLETPPDVEGLTIDDLEQEIDGILNETLPSPPAFTPVDPEAMDEQFGPATAGARAQPHRLDPTSTYSPEAYERATKHLEDLLNSKGYLNAAVGPASPVRARCAAASRGVGCAPVPLPDAGEPQCRQDSLGIPLPEPPLSEEQHCRPDPLRGLRCAPTMEVRIPVQLGPRTRLYDISFEGNRKWSDQELFEAAEYPLGSPLSTLTLDAARQRIANRYRDAGYAYASVRTNLELAPDRSRARARFIINEHEPVVITGYVIRGARRTDHDLIIGRLALCRDPDTCEGQERYYQRDLVRKSEEQIATLGTFTSVTIGLEDPDVPQKHKRVVITVVEQPSQYLEPRVGFSTGEGFRMAFEYGHRNIGGQAISLTVRLELSILPDLLIVEQDVRDNYAKFTISERLERRNRASVRFPEIGLGPLVALTVDGIDIRDNQRDYGLTKDAVIPTIDYAPFRTLRFQLGASTELNDVEVFGAGSVEQAVRQNPSLAKYLRVPDGRTLALAQRLGTTWDRRDNALAARRGTLVALDVEHVHAFPLDQTATIESEFLRLSGRSAAYVTLTDSGLVLAVSLAGGHNIQLTDSSQTYPDRLFYLGGVGTIRGFPLDSVVPEDIAQRVLSGELPLESIAVRGGDLFVNPRAELRIPLGDTFSLGTFIDTGNVWTGEAEFDSPLDLLELRYALGAGLRIGTPIGPIALDLGFNVLRREWEDLAAVHFSIGLF